MKTLIQTCCAAALWIASVALAAGQSVTLSWNSNPEPDIAAYILYFGNGPSAYHCATNVGNVTTATVRGLAAGTNWHFALTAVSTAGLQSVFSAEVIVRIPARPSAPTIITNYWIPPPYKLEILMMPMPSSP